MRFARRLIAAALGGTLMVGCVARDGTPRAAGDGETTTPPAPEVGDPALIARKAVAGFRDEPWTYDGRAGRVVVTPHYRVHFTQTEPAFVGRVPVFMESALAHYRTLATGAEHPLPAPPSQPTGERPMDVFIFRTRAEWERFTRQLLGPGAEPFLRIERGGYAWGGTAVLFDLDADPRRRGVGRTTRDTLAIAAHEGWHQFTQRTFQQPLPTWLEEGLATLCEGHEWVGGDPPVRFDAHRNAERRNRLRELLAAERAPSVERLVLDTPADLAAEIHDDAIDYYAQVWALALFLREGSGGRYAAGLRACIEDAAAGRSHARIVEVLGPDRARALTGRGGSPAGLFGLAVLEAYFGREPGGLAELDRAWRAFAADLASGSAP